MFRLPIVKFFSRILNRITITVVLVALQVAWLLWAFFSLTTGRVWVNVGLQLLSLFMMLYLVRKDENSAYKIGWIALMGVLPLLGGALYLSFGNKRPEKLPHPAPTAWHPPARQYRKLLCLSGYVYKPPDLGTGPVPTDPASPNKNPPRKSQKSPSGQQPHWPNWPLNPPRPLSGISPEVAKRDIAPLCYPI